MLTSSINRSARRSALVYDRLDGYGGGERVLEQKILLYPQSDLFSSIDILKPHERAFLHGKTPMTTFAQKLPLIRYHHRHFLLLLLFAFVLLVFGVFVLVFSCCVFFVF